MISKLNHLVDSIEAVDPARIRRMYPSEQQYKQYVDLKARANSLLSNVQAGGLPDELVSELAPLTGAMADLASQISSRTELGGKLLVNEMVTWAEALHYEYAIYLAGRCHDLDVREPYRTQIRLQPAHACMARHRSILAIYEWIRHNIHAEPNEDIRSVIFSLLRCLLHQFEAFATAAHKDNPTHVLAIYMLALSKIFRAQNYAAEGNVEGRDLYASRAAQIVEQLKEPNEETLKVELNYYSRISREFSNMELRRKYPNIGERLYSLGERADRIMEAEGGHERQCYFWFTSYVGGFARTASVVGVICTAAGAFGIDSATAGAAINDTWHIAVDSIPGLEQGLDLPYEGYVTADTGGLVASSGLQEISSMIVKDTGGLVLSTGGLV